MNQELRAKVNDIAGKMVILSYVPLRDKKASILRIAAYLDENGRRPDEIAAQVETLFILEIFNNYTNVSIDADFYRIFGEEFYDSLYFAGFVQAIESKCGTDIQRFRSLVFATLDWRNVFSLVDSFSMIDMSHVDALTQEVRDAKEKLSAENIQALRDMVAMNRPGVSDISDMVGASLVASLDKITDNDIAKWHENHQMVVDLDAILGEQALSRITNEIQDYFDQQGAKGTVDQKEVQSVYDYLKAKNQDEINKINYDIGEAEKASIEKGITSQMIKLLSEKKALDQKYKQQEELLKLADAILSMDQKSYDDIKQALEACKAQHATDSGESQ